MRKTAAAYNIFLYTKYLMRWLIWYIRSCFCEHAFEKEETVSTKNYQGEVVERNVRVSLICKKCGYHKHFDKF